MLGKVGFWIALPALDAAYQQQFAEPLRIRRAVARVATSGKRLKLQIAELEWPADTGQDVTGQPPGRPREGETVMSIIDDALSANATIANGYDPSRGGTAGAQDRDRHLRGSPANQHRADAGSRRWRCGHDQELRHRDR
jgi:hypothetical protein